MFCGVTQHLCVMLQVVNNFEWYRDMSFLGFLRDVGKHARMGTMLNKDSVKSRLAGDAGMSFTEFSYQLLQVCSACMLHSLLFFHETRMQAGHPSFDDVRMSQVPWNYDTTDQQEPVSVVS